MHFFQFMQMANSNVLNRQQMVILRTVQNSLNSSDNIIVYA